MATGEPAPPGSRPGAGREAAPRSDVGAGGFDAWPDASVHVEWGPPGARLGAGRGDVCVIVDVLSFSTTLAIATEHGAVALAYSAQELDELGGREMAAQLLHADVVASDRTIVPGRATLSPASLGGLRAGDRLVVTSLNGASCTAAASSAPEVLVGSLRNRTATAAVVTELLARSPAWRCTIVACGERWSSVAAEDGTRFAVEDWLGAGSIAACLRDGGLTLSAEAAVAAAAFDVSAATLPDVVGAAVSGRELVARGFADDVALAVELDASHAAVRRTSDPGARSFAAASPQPSGPGGSR